MAPLLVLCAALLDFAVVGRGVTIYRQRIDPDVNESLDPDLMNASEPEPEPAVQYSQARTPGWIQNVSHVLPVEGIENPEEQTAVVTFAGKKNVEYIDGAVMLGMSVQKHLPGYPMVALVISKMRRKHRALLTNASWSLAFVPNWDWDYCGEDCDSDFLGRWHDSFEKINAFRLPFKRVLFLDSDTYIFSSRIQELVKREMPDDHIALAMDGCKDEFNSGVMLYRPNLSVFTRMLELVSIRKREQILDQNLVNEVYRGKVQEVPREFNCVDTMGVQPGLRRACQIHCSEGAVVAHFTGHPKPTSAKRRLLELVRRPGAPAIACTNTNFGSCAKWSEYYCDIRKHVDYVSRELRHWFNRTGECCHSPFDPDSDDESCKECPSTLTIHSKKPRTSSSRVYGTYVKTSIKPQKFHGGKPIFVKWKTIEAGPPQYMFYIAKQWLWAIGRNFSTNRGIIAYAQKEAQCPRDAGSWHVYAGTDFNKEPLYLKAMPNGKGAPTDTEHVAWNIKEHRWDREHLPEEDDEEDQESLDHDEEEEEEGRTTVSQGTRPGGVSSERGNATTPKYLMMKKRGEEEGEHRRTTVSQGTRVGVISSQRGNTTTTKKTMMKNTTVSQGTILAAMSSKRGNATTTKKTLMKNTTVSQGTRLGVMSSMKGNATTTKKTMMKKTGEEEQEKGRTTVSQGIRLGAMSPKRGNFTSTKKTIMKNTTVSQGTRLGAMSSRSGNATTTKNTTIKMRDHKSP